MSGLRQAHDERMERLMGMTHVDLELANPVDLERWETVSCLVDSGATLSVVPTAILERLGIAPLAEQRFRLANGETIVRRRGGAVVRLRERLATVDVVFGEEGDANLLGVITLEALGFALDPLRRELREMPMLLA